MTVQAPERPAGALYDRAAAHARALEGLEGEAVNTVTAAWAEAYRAAQAELERVFSRIEAAREAGTPVNPAWLFQQGRIQDALDVAAQRLAQFGRHATGTVAQSQRTAIRMGTEHAAALGAQAVQSSLTARLAASFVHVNPAPMDRLVGHLANGTPLARLLQAAGREAQTALRRALIQGVTLGWGVDRMRRLTDKALNLPRHRAVTILRTELLRAYREASRATYRANADVLEGWTWRAHLDASTCAACVVMDGTFHGVDDRLDGHPRCRCAMVPRTRSWADVLGTQARGRTPADDRPPVRSGKAWLAAQPAAVQRAILGPGKAEAYQAGQITLDDVVAQTEDADWGTMRRERSLAEIREGRNANPATNSVPRNSGQGAR